MSCESGSAAVRVGGDQATEETGLRTSTAASSTSRLLGLCFLAMDFTTPLRASARLRWRLTVEMEQPTRAAMADSGWVGLACRSRWISSWSKLRPEQTPAKLSRSSGSTVTSRRARISRRWGSVVPACDVVGDHGVGEALGAQGALPAELRGVGGESRLGADVGGGLDAGLVLQEGILEE